LRDQCLVGLALIAFLWVASQVVGRVLHIVVVVLLALVLAYALEPAQQEVSTARKLERLAPRLSKAAA
jgi:predicted PurR-regulated permease PerM